MGDKVGYNTHSIHGFILAFLFFNINKIQADFYHGRI